MLDALLHIPTEVVINTFTVAVDQGQQFAPPAHNLKCQSKVSDFVGKRHTLLSILMYEFI